MRILVTGADGFIGSRLVLALRGRGHDVVRGVRRPGPQDVAIDFERNLTPEAWVPRLARVQVVINAVGVARGSMAAVHEQAPRALFAACVRAGVKRVVQISALGADEQAETEFHCSKRSADQALASLPLQWVIVLPSLVIGRGGASTGLFSALAALPVVPLPGRGDQRVQPIAVDDLIGGIVRLAESQESGLRLAAVGPEEMSLRELVTVLAGWLRVSPPRPVEVPLPLVHLVARVADFVGEAPVTSEMVKMLSRGSTADARPWASAVGSAPRALEQALDPSTTADRWYARLYFVRPLLRLSVAFIWLVTAAICAFFYPASQGYAMLEACGVPAALAPVAYYGACGLDGLLGLFLLLGWWNRPLLLFQFLLVGFYSLVILVALPEYWLQPFGPLTKNLPLMGAILALRAMEEG